MILMTIFWIQQLDLWAGLRVSATLLSLACFGRNINSVKSPSEQSSDPLLHLLLFAGNFPNQGLGIFVTLNLQVCANGQLIANMRKKALLRVILAYRAWCGHAKPFQTWSQEKQ
jgi:hypothetical protein